MLWICVPAVIRGFLLSSPNQCSLTRKDNPSSLWRPRQCRMYYDRISSRVYFSPDVEQGQARERHVSIYKVSATTATHIGDEVSSKSNEFIRISFGGLQSKGASEASSAYIWPWCPYATYEVIRLQKARTLINVLDRGRKVTSHTSPCLASVSNVPLTRGSMT